MATMIVDPDLESRLLAERAATGADRYDEVWEGIYVMAPMPNVEHQDIVNGFAAVFQEVIRWPGLGMVMPGANVSDQVEGWEQNYRVPDVAVFLHNGKAKNCGTHWCGGPDFVVEVLSQNDQTREKLAFYESIGTREVLMVDRSPWQLELRRLEHGTLKLVAHCSLENKLPVTSQVLALSFSLAAADVRPAVEVCHIETKRAWRI